MTYGRLIGEAKQLLHQTLNDYSMHTPADALVVCAARARLYRVLAGALALHLDLPRSAGRRQFLEYRGDGIKAREATLLHQLREDLLSAAQTAGGGWEAPPSDAPAGTQLARAADLAGAAFDLLAGHLHPPDPVASSRAPLRRGGTRVTARDAVQMARGLAHLDGKLEKPIRGLACTDIDAESHQRLVATAEDCKRVTRHGVREFAAAIHQVLRSPARRVVDSLDLAVSPGRSSANLHPSSAADLVSELRDVAHRRPDRLSVIDLAAMASTGARICALAAYACAPLGGPIGPALAAVRGWQLIYQELTSFATPSRGRNLPIGARQFRAWADARIRSSDPNEFADSTRWLPAIQSMTTDLADLAYSLTRAITHKVVAEELLIPFDPHVRGREHLYRPATATDTPVMRLADAADLAHLCARDLASDIHDIDPSAHPRPARAATALKRPAPDPTAATGRTQSTPPQPQRRPRPSTLRR
jgi:hypothetical protein